MASITIVPESGSITAGLSVCRVTVAGGEDTDISTYDANATPTEEAFKYRLVASAAGEDDLVSPEFTVSADGDWVWNSVIFPAAGSWTIDLVDQADDGVTATLAVTVA